MNKVLFNKLTESIKQATKIRKNMKKQIDVIIMKEKVPNKQIDNLPKSFHHFNYRIIKVKKENEEIYTIKDVWYNKKNKPTVWGVNNLKIEDFYGVSALKLEMKRFMKAFKYPILKEVKISEDKYKLVEEPF